MPHPGCNSSWLKFIPFSSTDLQRKVKIFNPTGKAVLAPCAWTAIKSQANILPTTPGLPQPFHTEAPEDKCTDWCVLCHQSDLQINKNRFLLFHHPYFSATTWAWMGGPGNVTVWALWSFFWRFQGCEDTEGCEGTTHTPGAPALQDWGTFIYFILERGRKDSFWGKLSALGVLWTVKMGFVRVIEWSGGSAFSFYIHPAWNLISDGE